MSDETKSVLEIDHQERNGSADLAELETVRADRDELKTKLRDLSHEFARHLIKASLEQEVAPESQEIHESEDSHLDLFDPLTGLLNKKGLRGVAESLMYMDEGTVGVMAMDLSAFKAVNDRFGHHGGDKLLVRWGRKLANILRTSANTHTVDGSARDAEDFVGHTLLEPEGMEEHEASREGGDEFTVVTLLSQESDLATQTRAMLEIETRVRAAFYEELDQMANSTDPAEREIGQFAQEVLDIAIGWAVQEADMSAEELCDKADRSMFENKEARKKQIVAEAPPEVQEKFKKYVANGRDPELSALLTRIGHRTDGLENLLPKDETEKKEA